MSNQKQEKVLPKAPPKKKSTASPKLGEGIDLPTTPADGDQKTDAYFDLVLVDMIASVRSDKLITTKKNMYDADYACLSYRWGEVPEQITLTPDYTAHITSFDLDDLLIVCQQILNWSSDGGNLPYEEEEEDEETGDDTAAEEEEDEETGDDTAAEEEDENENDQAPVEEEANIDPVHIYSEYAIPYLWVDAISVDQNDTVHKKNTIHRMTDIYHNSQVIIAVPDLHRGYLEHNPLNSKALDTISKYGRKIFRHVAQRCWRSEEEEEEEEAALQEEEEDYNEEQGDEQQQQEEEEEDYNEEGEDAATVIEEEDGKDDASSMTQQRKHRGFRQFIKESIYAKQEAAVDGLYVTDPRATEEQQQEQEQATDDNNDDDEEQEEQEYVCTCTDDLDERETDAYWDAVEFLHYLIDDWSARVWVISEYNIGRHTNMRLWFVSICYGNYDNRPREILNMFNARDPTIYDSLLQERPFLHMMLNSKATRDEDRFYAVLPLYSRYKHMAADHAISTWGITNIISVRLQLYSMVSFEEKLTMLLCGVRPSFKSDVMLPSFTAFYRDASFDWAHDLANLPALIKAMDLHQLEEEGSKMHYLAVTVPWSRTFTDHAVEHDLNVAGHALTRLGLSELLEELVTVFIPITVHNEQTQHTLGIKLFGHREQNKWIMLHRMVDLVDVPPTTPTPPTEADTDKMLTQLPGPPHHAPPHPPHRSASLDTLWSEKMEMDQVFHIY